MTKPLTWWAVARRPKWVGGFVVAMLVATVCGLLAQWQIGRSVEEPLHNAVSYAAEAAHAPNISSVIKPGVSPTGSAVGTLVKFNAIETHQHAWVIGSRVQRDGTAGFWVVTNQYAKDNVDAIVTLGFTRSKTAAYRVAKNYAFNSQAKRIGTALIWHQTVGRLSPSEAPQQTDGTGFSSLSVGQLANLVDSKTKTYPLFVLQTRTAISGLQRITVETLSNAQINWLSAFYSIEWTVFMGFSFFMWWRLVRDEQQRLNEPATAL